jgi:hypothetical protein
MGEIAGAARLGCPFQFSDRLRLQAVKQAGLLLLGLAVTVLSVAVGCGSTKTVTKTVTVSPTAKSGVGSPRQVVEYGYIKSLKPKGGGYQMLFDPAWLLTGKTANQAALEDTGSSDVPNDNYIVNESPRAYFYLVSPHAHVTVLKEGVNGSAINVAQLAQLASGRNPFPKPLFEPISTGFWISIRNDTVDSLEQQYHP